MLPSLALRLRSRLFSGAGILPVHLEMTGKVPVPLKAPKLATGHLNGGPEFPVVKGATAAATGLSGSPGSKKLPNQ